MKHMQNQHDKQYLESPGRLQIPKAYTNTDYRVEMISAPKLAK